MSRLRIAVAQYSPVLGDRGANLALAIKHVGLAHDAGAELLVLPELASSGYVFESSAEAKNMSQKADGEFGSSLSAAAGAGLTVVAGFAEEREGILFNSAMVVDESGVRAVYRKVHLFFNEKRWFQPGTQLLTVAFPWGTLGLAICYDLWFPEVVRTLALAGATVIAVPNNWVSSFKRTVFDEQGWCQANHIALATAAQNAVALACSDRVGEERGTRFLGCSCVVGPDGWLLAGPASQADDALLVADLDTGAAAAARARTPLNDLHGDRAPLAYHVERV